RRSSPSPPAPAPRRPPPTSARRPPRKRLTRETPSSPNEAIQPPSEDNTSDGVFFDPPQVGQRPSPCSRNSAGERTASTRSTASWPTRPSLPIPSAPPPS